MILLLYSFYVRIFKACYFNSNKNNINNVNFDKTPSIYLLQKIFQNT